MVAPFGNAAIISLSELSPTTAAPSISAALYPLLSEACAWSAMSTGPPAISPLCGVRQGHVVSTVEAGSCRGRRQGVGEVLCVRTGHAGGRLSMRLRLTDGRHCRWFPYLPPIPLDPQSVDALFTVVRAVCVRP